MCVDWCLHCFFGGPFRNYQLRLLGFEESKEYDKDSIQDDEHFIGILCFCQKEVRCAELLCYFTTFKRTHCALGFHCHTQPQHRRRGLIKALMQIAVCLLPVFKQRVVMAVNPSTPFVIGCQSINPIVFHSMQTSLGCTIKQEDTYALSMRKIRLKCDVHPPPLPTAYDEDTVHRLDGAIRKMFNTDTFLSQVPLLSIEAIHACSNKVLVNRVLRDQFQKHCAEYKKAFGNKHFIQKMQDHEDVTLVHESLCTNSAFNIAGNEMEVCAFVQKHLLHTLCWSVCWRSVLSLLPNWFVVDILRNGLHYQFQL